MHFTHEKINKQIKIRETLNLVDSASGTISVLDNSNMHSQKNFRKKTEKYIVKNFSVKIHRIYV